MLNNLANCSISAITSHVQVGDALDAVESHLGHTLMSLTWQFGPAFWQTSLAQSWYPSGHSREPEAQQAGAAAVRVGQDLGAIMEAAAALHGLPATPQPASAAVLSCIRGLGGVLHLLSTLAAKPGFVDHISGVDLGATVGALSRLTPAMHGCAALKEAGVLLGLIRSSKPDVVQRAEEEEQQRRCTVMLSLATAWKVCIV